MKRYALILLPLAIIALILLPAAGQAGAEPPFPISQLTMTICERGAPEKMWFTEDTGHGRNMPQQWVMDSEDPRFVGTGYDIVNWNLNLVTNAGVSWGDYELLNSTGVDGWIGKWQGKLYPANPPVIGADGMGIWLFEGRGQGHGYGQYDGLQEHFDVHMSVSVYPNVAEALDHAPCVTGATLDGQVFVMTNHINAFVTGSPEQQEAAVCRKSYSLVLHKWQGGQHAPAG